MHSSLFSGAGAMNCHGWMVPVSFIMAMTRLVFASRLSTQPQCFSDRFASFYRQAPGRFMRANGRQGILQLHFQFKKVHTSVPCFLSAGSNPSSGSRTDRSCLDFLPEMTTICPRPGSRCQTGRPHRPQYITYPGPDRIVLPQT